MNLRNSFIGLLVLIPALPLPAALAEDFVVREYSFDVGDIDAIEFHGGIGAMHILPGTGSELKLVLEIEATRQGWFRRAPDISGVELQSRVDGSRLRLEQTGEDTKTTWTIELPVVARTRVKMGVGEIRAELGATAVDIELGVGSVDLTLPLATLGDVALSAGVGEAKLRGLQNRSSERSFVSQDVRGRGEGDLDARVHVGVGDIDLSAR